MSNKNSGGRVMLRKILLVLLILFGIEGARLYGQGGDAAVPFLLIAPNSRASSMGESGVALADDASAMFWNPAGLAFQRGTEINFTHSKWLPQFVSDLFYEYASIKHHMESIGGTIGATLIYFNLGQFERRDENNNFLGYFKAFEFAVAGGYATKLSESFGIGTNLRFIYSKLSPFGTAEEKGEGVASGVSFDIGLLWRPARLRLPIIGKFDRRFSIGLNLSNLGPAIHYIDRAQADPIPTHLRFGFAIKVIETKYNNLVYTIDFGRILVRRYKDKNKKPDPFYKAIFTAWDEEAGGLKKVTIGTGFEYWYGSPRLIALRAGYFIEHPNFGGRRFMTFGAGIRYSFIGVDFSYISTFEQNHPLANTLRFSLAFIWGEQD
jgi:hypothetical protein